MQYSECHINAAAAMGFITTNAAIAVILSDQFFKSIRTILRNERSQTSILHHIFH